MTCRTHHRVNARPQTHAQHTRDRWLLPHAYGGPVRPALSCCTRCQRSVRRVVPATVEEICEAIGYGVIKMNIDTDLQFAFTEGIRDYMVENIDYLKTQIGNPDGKDQPNKKNYDPRKWLRLGEQTFKQRLIQAFEDLNNINTLA